MPTGRDTSPEQSARLTIGEEAMKGYASDTLFVVYCAGPHCNGATKAAVALARLGRPVKEMIGGITGWLDEGFGLVQGSQTSAG